MINVNDLVCCRLTKRGAFLLNEQNRDLMFRFPGQKLRADYKADEVYEQYYWVLAKTMSEYFQIGSEAPYTHLWKPDHNRAQQPTPTPQEAFQ